MKFTVTSWVGGIEVVDGPASAWAALELVLALLGHKRTDVRIFDQNGRRRTPAELCLLASKEVAMLPDESELSFSLSKAATTPHGSSQSIGAILARPSPWPDASRPHIPCRKKL
jgi:hypothetical protein